MVVLGNLETWETWKRKDFEYVGNYLVVGSLGISRRKWNLGNANWETKTLVVLFRIDLVD